jgi:OHCU decarboxylase
MSEASRREQSDAGLTSLDRAKLEELGELNRAYREKFTFPFLYAVKGSTGDDILRALKQRLNGEMATELTEALSQVYRIARFRLEDIVS